MYELRIRETIGSAHFLRGYEGKCKNLHGHNWKIEAVIVSDALDELGMVADFSVLKKKLMEFLSTMDHICLNDIDIFKQVNPTTENMARYIFDAYAKEIAPFSLKSIEVWESESSSVRYYK